MAWFGLKADKREETPLKNAASTSAAYQEPPTDDVFKAYIPNFLYKPPFGYPLNKNILQLRELAKNAYIFSVIRTLKDEASTTKWEIKLKKEYAKEMFDTPKKEDPAKLKAFEEPKDNNDANIKRISNWFNNPNGNEESFTDIIGQWIVDLCEVDAAVGVKVFNKKDEFSQLFARDGASFLKNPDIFGYMGNREEFVKPLSEFNPNLVMPEKIKIYGATYGQSAAYFQYGWTGNALPVPFGRREIIYMMANARADSIYGRSPLEVIQDALMTLIYGINYNLDFYLNGNAPDGLINLVGADANIVKAFQERMKDKFKLKDNLGNLRRVGHTFPVYGGPAASFIPFQISSKDLEIIDQQKWFTKLVWSAFGVTPDEMGYCYSSDTRVLTNNGFKYYFELNKDDKIATIIENQEIEYIKPSNIHTFNVVDKKFHHYKNNCVDTLVSDDHRMFYKTIKDKNWRMSPSNEINVNTVKFLQGGLNWNGVDKTTFKIPLVKYENNKDKNRVQQIIFGMNDFCEFMGYYLSEGNIWKKGQINNTYTIKISQTNENGIKIMSPLLTKLGFRRKNDCWLLNNKSLAIYLSQFGSSMQKYVPEELKNLSKQKLQILFDAYIVGDGTKNMGKNSFRCASASKRLSEDMLEISLKLGYKASFSVREFIKDNWNDSYIVNGNKSQIKPRVILSKQREDILYTGVMWCPSVKNRPFITELNGKLGIHYNTEDSNKAVSQTQSGVNKRKALKPLLKKIEYVVNSQIMIELDPSGKFEFAFEDYDLDEELKQHNLYKLQVDMGMKTAEMCAEEEGIDISKLKAQKEEDRQKKQDEMIKTNPGFLPQDGSPNPFEKKAAPATKGRHMMMELGELINEHKKLVEVLKEDNPDDVKEELEKQKAELEKYMKLKQAPEASVKSEQDIISNYFQKIREHILNGFTKEEDGKGPITD